MANDFVLAPALVNVRFALEPAANALQSLRLLNDIERLSGLHDWVTGTAAALPAERLFTNRLVFMIFEPSMLVPELPPGGFPALIDAIEQMPPQRVFELIDADFDRMFDLYPEHAERVGGRVKYSALLNDRAAYINFLNKLEEVEEDELFGTAFDLAQNPAEVQRVVGEHLRYMWETHLRTEWERQLPKLNESLNAFTRLDFSSKTLVEAARIVTNRDLSELIEHKGSFEKALFVPNPHMGPYISLFRQRDELVITYGARLPRGAQSPAQSEFSRADLLIRLNALADDTRLQILELLTQHDELGAQELIERLGVSQSTVSRHLSQLRATGYIIERRREVAKFYSLNTDRVMDTLRALTNFLSRQ